MNRLLSQPMPKGGLEQAKYSFYRLEEKRIDNLKQHVETQLKQPGLSQDQINGLLAKSAALKKEYLDLSARFKDIPPLPET